MVVAIEGPSYSGKSTLAREVEKNIEIKSCIVLPCYVEFAGGDHQVPDSPTESVEEELRAQRFYRSLDHKRMRSALRKKENPIIIIMDRSIHTLLAHAWAIRAIKGFPAYKPSRRRALDDSQVTWPHFIIYLDITQKDLNDRYKGSDVQNSIFFNPVYNQHFRDYFLGDSNQIDETVVPLDSSRHINELSEKAIYHIRNQC